MAKEERGEVELLDAPGVVIEIRYLSQTARNEINDRHTRRGEVLPNWRKVTPDIADAMIVGWSGLTRRAVRRLGFQDAESLPVDDAGEIPYTVPTARKLFVECEWAKFAGPLNEANSGLLEAIDRKNELQEHSSEK